MEENGGVWTDKLDIAWAEYDATGQSLGSVTQSISVKLSQQRREAIAREGITFSETVDVKIGAVEARMAVRDAGSGAIRLGEYSPHAAICVRRNIAIASEIELREASYRTILIMKRGSKEL